MVTSEEYVRRYLGHLQVEQGRSAHTIAAYRRDLARYLRFLTEQQVTHLTDVTSAQVSAFVSALRTGSHTAEDRAHGGNTIAGKPLAASSAARALVAVRSLYRFLHREGFLAHDPAAQVTPPSMALRLPKALTVSQVVAILTAAGIEDSATALRDVALLELLYATGARVSEIVSLDVDDANFLREQATQDVPVPLLRVFGKGGKERLVPVGQHAISALDAYLVRARPGLAARGRAGAALFLNRRGARLSRQSAWEIVQDCARRGGVEGEVSPHSLRHSFATHILQGGADVRCVQELLGHSSVTTTQIYTRVTVDTLREVYAVAHPRARRSP